MGWFSDIGNAVSSAVGAVGDVVEGAVDAISDTVNDVVDVVVDTVQGGLGWANEWLCRNVGSVACRFGNIVLGGLSGLLEGLQDIAGKVFDIIGNVGGLIGALLRGDLAGFLSKFVEIIADAIELGLNVLRFVTLGTVIGGIRDAWQAEDLRRFVGELLEQRFADNPPLHARIRAHIGLDGTGWGFPFKGTHRVMRLDSATAPLWQWHKDGVIDLYAMAGLISFDSFNFLRKRSVVRSMNADGTESWLPINRWTLAHYIDSEGQEGRIRVYALSRDAITDFTQVATDKFKKLGIELDWNDGGRFDFFGSTVVHDITTLEELNFDRTTLGRYLVDSGLRSMPANPQCDLLSLAAFKLVKGLGQTSGRDIREGSESSPCDTTPERDDQCCISVDRREGAGVVYHDQWPLHIFRYVLAHEGGHYVGLCHFGHDGLQNVMYTPAKEAGLSWVDWGLLKYYLDNEPGFTLQDGKNVWRFLVAQLVPCLDPQGPGPIIT